MNLKTLYSVCLLIFTKVLIAEQQSCGGQKGVSFHEPDDKLRDNLLNPARGFYIDSITSARYFQPLTKDHLKCLRDNHGTILMLRMYSLDTFADGSPISDDFKHKLEQDFKAAKDAGWSLVLRFMYENNLDTQYDPRSEPSVPQIQEHIKQLSPVITRYDGIVVSVQAGFHGEYGLWYTPGTDSTQQDTSILKTLLQELPPTIPVQIPHPDYKRSLGQSTTTRLGHYHECLLEGDTNNIKTAFPDLKQDPGSLLYLKKDTETSVIGGKTCHPGDTSNPPRNLCIESEKLFKNLHLTYLNAADPSEAIQNYERNGCFTNISNTLGYRLTLESVSLPDYVNVNSSVCVGITLTNRGYASPFRQYNVSLILQDASKQSIAYEAKIDTDTTKWLPGIKIDLTTSFQLPQNTRPATNYQVYLKISEPKLETDSDYYVLMSNSNPNIVTANGLNKIGSLQIPGSFRVKDHAFRPTTTLKSRTMPPVFTNPRTWSKVSRSCLMLPNGPPTTTGPPLALNQTGTTLQTTTSPPFVPFLNDTSKLEKCKKLDTVRALLLFTYFSHPATAECPNSSSKASPEAILVSFCNAPTDTILWRPKGRVIDNCEKIPMYSRVGVFSKLNYYDYDTNIRKCGVFLGCLKTGSKVTGVKIGMQLCGRPFDIENAHFSNELDLDRLYVF